MITIVSPTRGAYRLLFFDGRHVTAVGQVELAETQKGIRPKEYRVRQVGRRQFKNTPTKELVNLLRSTEVMLTAPSPPFEAFLADLQLRPRPLNACRLCLLEDRVTQVREKDAVRYGKEMICLPCARRELRREVAHFGRMARGAVGHLDELLYRYRDVDRVLAAIQPETTRKRSTLYDRVEAHAVGETQALVELPLPRPFVEASGVERLMPVQQLSVEAGLLYGKDLLVVAATASGKTFIGEMAGVKNYVEGHGRMLFLVPLVALAVQKHQRFAERYGEFARASLQIGKARIRIPENRGPSPSDPRAALVVGTYEGVDHQLRLGRFPEKIGTVVIDEVQMLEDPERGHRLDGMIARLKHLFPHAQFLYLSATIGSPKTLAKKLGATLVQYESRPVPLDRHLVFVEKKEKIPTIKRLVEEEYRKRSSKGFHGQTIVFTNARARCQVVAEKLGKHAAAYHAGLTAQERREVEDRFLKGKLAAVVTTAALGAGVDFPASQVIFDALAMGISWLTVQEFQQMSGRAGRPDFHDEGRVVVLAEPGATYSRDSSTTEEEVAVRLLRGEMGEVAPTYDLEQSSEEFAANAVVARGNAAAISAIEERMVGTMEPVLPDLIAKKMVLERSGRLELTPLARIMAENFIGVERLLLIRDLVKEKDDPIEILTELECEVD
ncbi:MAG: DEAD/DEAH box helicase [Methanoregulaceae archaeon]